MDFLAHGLWATAGAIGVRRKTHLAASLGWTAFWGVFPDLFSFTVPLTLKIWWLLTGATKSLLPDPDRQQDLQFVWQLYNCSHSLVIFGLVFGLAWLFVRRPVYAMLAWALHIAIDIFTHGGIFATRFLWPFSSLGWDGTPWENRWFLAGNYIALAGVYLLFVRSARAAATAPHSGRRGGRQPVVHADPQSGRLM
jgi:hypothetical protein